MCDDDTHVCRWQRVAEQCLTNWSEFSLCHTFLCKVHIYVVFYVKLFGFYTVFIVFIWCVVCIECIVCVRVCRPAFVTALHSPLHQINNETILTKPKKTRFSTLLYTEIDPMKYLKTKARVYSN